MNKMNNNFSVTLLQWKSEGKLSFWLCHTNPEELSGKLASPSSPQCEKIILTMYLKAVIL